jgi:CRISPR system Cascade subunit CasA
MSQANWNLLTQPLLQGLPAGWVSLPGLLASLARDEVDSFPALRPHQAPAWHMFLVQLAALALHRAGTNQLPQTEPEWAQALRGLTPEFPEDEPWRLVVEDWSKPAFLQPPVPAAVTLKTEVSTPDALDLLITSRNHDLKQAVAHESDAQDWVMALVSLQTGEGYGGAGNQGIVRMNGGSSSRSMFGLAPLPARQSKLNILRPGIWFRRDVEVLLATREAQWSEQRFRRYPRADGLGLTWLVPWYEGEQLGLEDLDLWFIEVCRRVRLKAGNGHISAQSGNSASPRISGKQFKGAIGDPWAPVHVTEGKSFTLAGRSFDYSTLVEVLFSGDWEMPLLARPAADELPEETMALVAEALSRGNSKTEGFKSRILPIGGKIALTLSVGSKRKELHELARKQIEEIEKFDKALRDAIALAAAGGNRDSLRKEHYAHSDLARTHFDREANEIFFDHLWARYQAQEEGGEALKSEAKRFAHALLKRADVVFEASLPGIPCPSLYRPRAEARARSRFHSKVRNDFPELFPSSTSEEDSNVVT